MQHSISKSTRIGHLTSIAVMLTMTLHSALGETSFREDSPAVASLSVLREAVLANEARASLIRMEYKYFSDSDADAGTGPSRDAGSAKRLVGGRGNHAWCLYAQDGERVHSTYSLYAGEKLLSGWERVINGEVTKTGTLPDLMHGWIDYIEKFDWMAVPSLKIGFHPFQDKYRLSELLVPTYASMQQANATIDGRDCAVVRIRRPSKATYYSLLWIDLHRGMPLRIEHYAPSTNAEGYRRTSIVDSIKLHKLPNDGWIPVEGTSRGQTRSGSTRTARVVVDVNSISIDRKDIPESLFDIKFPPGAKVENGIIGAVLPGDLLVDPLALAVLDQTAQEMLAPSASSQASSGGLPESPALVSMDNNSALAGRPPSQTVQAAGVSVSWWRTPLLWISVCASLLAFGLTGLVYSLRAGQGAGGRP
jgi:hypothetical protein